MDWEGSGDFETEKNAFKEKRPRTLELGAGHRMEEEFDEAAFCAKNARRFERCGALEPIFGIFRQFRPS